MEYVKDGFVSLWVGNIKSGDLLEKLMEEDYTDDGDLISTDFAKYFKTGRYDEDFKEVVFFKKGISNLPDALNLFSYSDTFISHFEHAAENKQGYYYNTIILLYNFRYCGRKKEINSEEYGFLKFIGFVRYDYSKETLVSEVTQIFGIVPWEYEKKLHKLSLERRKCLFDNISKIKTLQDLDSYL